MPKVYAPNRAYSGRGAAGIMFVNGVAETDNPAALEYFRRTGYGIGREPATGEPAPVIGPEPVQPEVTLGAPLRDAAIAPLPKDFLPPTHAGEADPHGPLVVSPGLHAVPPAPIRPGPVAVDDTARQNAEETALAELVLVKQEPATVVAAESSDRPAARAKVGDWRDYAVAQGVDPMEAAELTKDELLARFGEG